MSAHGSAGNGRLLWALIVGASPMILVQCATYLVGMITVMKLGRYDATWLAGASLGGLVFNVGGLMLVVAPLTALDTVAPQAWGAGRPAEVGLSAQRAVLCSLLFLLPALPVWGHAEAILVALGQPAEAARLAALFLSVLLPALPVMAVFEAARRFLYAQDVRGPPLVAAALGLLLHPLWMEAFIVRLRLGYVGGPLAMLVTHCVMLGALLAILAYRAPYAPKSWPGLSPRRLFRDRRACGRFISLAVAGWFALSEWVFWEAVCFRAGRLGPLALAVHGTAYSLLPLCWMLPFGVSMGVSNGVGQRLGGRRVGEAKRVAAMGFVLGLGLTVLNSAAVYALRRPILALYTADEAVVSGAEEIWPWLCLDLLCDGSFALVSGLNRGLGLQRRSAACIVACLWGFGMPLVFFGTDSVLSIWKMMPLVYLLVDCSNVGCFACARWSKLSEAIALEASLGAHADSARAAQLELSSPAE